jgi:CHASE2 domain-containing sensor protein
MLMFDERALKASINTLLESIQAEDFEGKVRRLEEERLLLDSERKRRIRVRVASVAVACAFFLAALTQLFDVVGLDERVATVTMLLARIGAPAPPWSGEVVLVGIDEASERAVGRKFDPSWRAEHAALITNAASAAARTVAFDMVLEDSTSEAANAALRDALAATRERMPVVFGVQGPTRDGTGLGAMLAPFSSLARQGIACASLEGGQAMALPLAILRPASAASAAGTSSARGASAAGSAPQFDWVPSFALAAYSGGGRIELIDESAQSVVVRLRPQRRTQTIEYYKARTLSGPEPGCEVLQPGDRVLRQLIDPYALPPLRTAPQRIAYERIVAGDATALALLKNRVVVVGALLGGSDREPLPWPAEDRWGVELFAAQIDAMARDVAIMRIDPIAEWALMSALALLGAYVGHRLRERPRALRIAALAAIAFVWVALSIAWYRSERQLVGVPYDIAALAMGAWLANRNRRRTPA